MPATARTTATYGYDHKQTRKRLLPAALGTPCPGGRDAYGNLVRSPKCTRIMTNPRLMHLDHTHAVALGGTAGDRIICKPCNLTAGTTLGNQLRRGLHRQPTRRTRSW